MKMTNFIFSIKRFYRLIMSVDRRIQKMDKAVILPQAVTKMEATSVDRHFTSFLKSFTKFLRDLVAFPTIGGNVPQVCGMTVNGSVTP
jgi:hypothetical protein